MPSRVERVDDFQRRHPVVGFPLAVTYKFFDDQSAYLAAVLTHYAFVSIFPLLLISTSILGFVLRGNTHLQQVLLSSALAQFPIVGSQLAAPEGLQGSSTAVVVGSLAATYGVVGLGQAILNVNHAVWAIPRNSRPNPILSRVRSGGLVLLAGLAVLVIASLSVAASTVEVFNGGIDVGIRWAVDVVASLVIVAVVAAILRLASPSDLGWRHAFLGGLFIGVMLRLLQALGGAYVTHVVRRATEVNGVFALVLGLVGLIFVAANVVLLGLQITVVSSNRLWPRALLTPFTDAVSLTDADRRAYASYARAQRHKGFEHVQVTFEERGS